MNKKVDFNYNTLKVLVNSPQMWKVLDNYLDYLYTIKQNEIERQRDPTNIYRIQGFIEALNTIRKARGVVNAK